MFFVFVCANCASLFEIAALQMFSSVPKSSSSHPFFPTLYLKMCLSVCLSVTCYISFFWYGVGYQCVGTGVVITEWIAVSFGTSCGAQGCMVKFCKLLIFVELCRLL